MRRSLNPLNSLVVTLCVPFLLATGWSTQAVAATQVCVETQVKSWAPEAQDEAESSADGNNGNGKGVEAPDDMTQRVFDPHAVDPALYLQRMISYEVTHEVGFEAVEQGCGERIIIELYALRSGWTVFARYSGNAREEKVDEVYLDEFVALAQRVTRALLRDQPIVQTITRENVLRADSERNWRTIAGRGHLSVALGTAIRAGQLPTADSTGGAVKEDLRVLTPLNIHLGYRGKFQAWGLDAFARASLGTSTKAVRKNEHGVDADFDASGSMGLHFLRYLNGKGMTSFYYGGGAAFELARFSVIRAADDRASEERDLLWGGGLNFDLLLGYEFMRTSSLHFFAQGELHVPAYRLESDNDAGGLKTYLPGGLLQIGVIF